jgi:hypothetical protein
MLTWLRRQAIIRPTTRTAMGARSGFSKRKPPDQSPGVLSSISVGFTRGVVICKGVIHGLAGISQKLLAIP